MQAIHDIEKKYMQSDKWEVMKCHALESYVNVNNIFYTRRYFISD